MSQQPSESPVSHPGFTDLLQVLNGGNAHDPSRWVYANRSLRMDLIEVIGFDMDYTLAMYRKHAIESLAAEATIDKLIDAGYPDSLRKIEYDDGFVIRGLAVDKRHGNLFKMDKHRHVTRAFHGFEPLDKSARRRVYRAETIRLSAPRYHLIDTLFGLPEAYLYAAIVDLFEREGRRNPDYAGIFKDIRSAIDVAHQDGSIKRTVLADVERFIVSDPELAPTLHKFRSAGKRLFLLTNSYFTYTQALMSHLFDGTMPEYPSWRHYFDLICVGAKKPGFFTLRTPFREVDPRTGEAGADARGPMERGKIYEGGCATHLQRNLKASADRILYVGDHIYGDVLRAKKTSAWRTAMVIQEMRRELEIREGQSKLLEELVRLESRRMEIDAEIARDQATLRALQKICEAGLDHYSAPERQAITEAHRRARGALEGDRRALRKVLDDHATLDQNLDRAYNPHWGPLFKDGVEHSVFGGQVEDYACLYTSHVSNFLGYSPTGYFRAPRDRMPHEHR